MSRLMPQVYDELTPVPGSPHWAAAMLAICLTGATWCAACAGAEPCLGPTIVTVHGTASNDFVGAEYLAFIGFTADPDGTLAFAYAFELQDESVFESPGFFSVLSYDADGNLLDTINLSPILVGVAVRDEVATEPPSDHYVAQVQSFANNFSFLMGPFLEDRVDHDVLPGDPEEYLNDLEVWTTHEFVIGVDVDGIGIHYTSLLATITSLSATFECHDLTVDLDDLLDTLPDSAFHAASGHRTAFQSRLDDLRESILAGDVAEAIEQLRNLRRRVDGCGLASDNDDWIVDCDAQIAVRALIDELIKFLGG
jgi:hypothetical protein